MVTSNEERPFGLWEGLNDYLSSWHPDSKLKEQKLSVTLQDKNDENEYYVKVEFADEEGTTLPINILHSSLKKSQAEKTYKLLRTKFKSFLNSNVTIGTYTNTKKRT